MQFKKSLLTATLLTVAGLTAVSSANAADPIVNTLNISLEITELCLVTTANPITLNTIVANSEEARAGQTDFTVACSKDTPYNIAMVSAGGGNLVGETDAQTLAYTLSDTAEGTSWSPVVGEATSLVGAGFSVPATPYTVYVKVTGDMNDVKPDIYKDIVTATLTY